jgi:cysteinyl-tRNA synthetase
MMSASGPAIVFPNTLTGERETFTPRRAGKVALFTCGPSVYSRPHIGNYRTYLYEDILHRFLVSRGYSLNRVLNFTDIEDKTIDEAKRRGLSLFDLTRP